MEVTRLNFKDALPVISQAIDEASFLSMDTEFSGITSRKRENALDTCKERYQKVIEGTKDFTILQFGLCSFKWNDEQEQYVAKPFNFYIFPKPFGRQMPDMRFICQSSSLDFLANQGFDFNKWIHHGIPFLLPHNEDKLRQLMESRRSEDHNESISHESPSSGVHIPPEYEKTIDNIMKEVEDFTEDPDKKTLSLPPSSPVVRKLVHRSVNSTYNSGLHLENKVNENKKEYIMISKVSDEVKKCLEDEKYNREEEEIEMAVGFSKVIRLISKSGKVILGHNMLLDLMHVIRLFVCPLPSDLDRFKALVKGIFPRLVDTKVMASTQPLQEHFQLTHLEEVYKKSSEKPFKKPDVLLPEGFGEYSESTKTHEAGFDAFITGVSFASMVAYLQKIKDGDSIGSQIDFEIVKPFLNKIFLFPRIEDIPYLNLNGKDITPRRDHVFYIEFPETWQTTDIRALFKDFGYVYVSWLDSTSALVSVAKRERARKVLDKLNVDDAPYRIMSYDEYHDGLWEDYKDHDERNYDSLNKTHDITPSENTVISFDSNKEVSVKPHEQTATSDNEMEEGEIPDSPEPPRKKLKGQHIWFDEPDNW